MTETESIVIIIPNFHDKDEKNYNSLKKEDANTIFLKAARLGNLEKVQDHINSDVDINVSNANGLNALHLASKERHLDVVKEVLDHGAAVDACTKKGNTALHIASLAGHLDVVELLVERGADVNLQSSNGFTPLYMASQENHIEVVEYLLQHGALQNLTTEDGFTPLAVSLQQGHEKVVALLLEHDGGGGRMRLPALHIAAKKDDVRAAKLLLQNNSEKSNKAKNLVNDITKSGFTPLHIAAHYGNNNVGRLLIEHGADANFKARNLITPLHISSKWGRLAMVVLLLDCGAEVDPQTRDGLTPMHCAARSGHHQVVEALLKRGAKVEMKTVNGLTPLHMAIQGDHEVCAKILLLHNSGINEITVDYLTPLHVAAHCGNVKTAKLVLQDKKCEVNARALNGFTPLHIACKKNRIKIVELLLKHGATMEATTESGLTPLHVASFMGYLNIVLHLIQHGSNPNSSTCRGETSLHLAARANQTDIVRVLLRNGATVQAKSWDDQTALHVASRLGNVDNVLLLLRHGASPDDMTKDLSTPLHLAAREGHLEVIQVLLDHGAKKEIMNKKGFTALHLACRQDHHDIVDVLLDRGCNCDQTSNSGLTPLHVCAHYGRPNIASLLLKHDAKIAIATKNGYTPLHIAAKKNRMEIASMLLEAGASVNSEINNGLTPLDLACQQGHVEMVQLLLENSADTNHRASKGVTSMHLTAQEDKVQVAPSLVQHGANINAQTKAGYTPLHMACHYGQVAMVKFLLDNGATIDATTKQGYTPLHHAAQQGHIQVVNLLLKSQASPNLLTNAGQSAMNIASRLGYVSIVEILRPITNQENAQPMADGDQEKYKVVLPEVVMETSLSESEDETVEDSMTLFFGKSYDQFPRGYDSIDSMALQQQQHYHHHHQLQQQQHDNKQQKQLDNKIKQRVNSVMETSGESTVYVQEEMMYMKKDVQLQSDPSSWICSNDDDGGDGGVQSPGARAPGFRIWTSFLVSFLVDARGGLYKGCRHSGLRVVVPPNHTVMPMRVTCRLVRRDKVISPPPLSDGEAVAGRIVDFAPSGVQLNGPILFEIPHSSSLGGDREVVVVRSDDGLNWTIHHPPPPDNDPKMETLLNQVAELGLSPTPPGHVNKSSPVSHAHVITNHLPRYFALISRVKMEVKIVEGQGGVVSSKVVPLVQAVLPSGSVSEPSFFGLQAQEIPPSLVAKLAGNRAAVASVITMEPQGKHFDKPVTITTPLPTPSQKGMINRYGKDASSTTSSLKLLACSNRFSTFKYLYDNHPVYGVPCGYGKDGTTWEDITMTTPLKLQNDHASFNTTVAARFWLVDCQRSDREVVGISSEIFVEANRVPFLTRILVFAKRLSSKDAAVRLVLCADGEDFDGRAALEGQERFKEIARSKVVEVMEGKPMQVGMTGNLTLVAKSGEQLSVAHNSSEDSKLTFFVRVKDTCQPATGIVALLPLPQTTTVPTADSTSPSMVNPVCCLNVAMPEVSAASESGGDDEEEEDDEGTGSLDQQHVLDSDEKDGLHHKEAPCTLNLRAIADLLQSDWLPLAAELHLTSTQIEDVQSNCEFQGEKALAMLQLWSDENEHPGDKVKLLEALAAIGRDDVVAAVEGPAKKKVMNFAQETGSKQKDYLDKNYDPLKDEIGSTCEFDSSRGSTLQPGMTLISYEGHAVDGDEEDDDDDGGPKVENNAEEELKSIPTTAVEINAKEEKEEEEEEKEEDEDDVDEYAKGSQVDRAIIKSDDGKLRHVLNYEPKGERAVDEERIRRTTEESMELLPDGRRMRRTTETLTKFTKSSVDDDNVAGGGGDDDDNDAGEKGVKSIHVVEHVTILGPGVEEPYDEDDVFIEVVTEHSEQECEDGSTTSRSSTTTTVELKRQTEVDESPIIAVKAPGKASISYHFEEEEQKDDDDDDEEGKGDDVDGFRDVTTTHHHGDGVDDDIDPTDVPIEEKIRSDEDQVSVYEEQLVKEQNVKNEAVVDLSSLEKYEDEAADGKESIPDEGDRQ